MEYIKNDGTYPVYYGQIEAENPDWKFPEPAPTGYREVYEVQPPNIAEDEAIDLGAPVEKDGKLYQNWTVRKMTADEIERRNAPKTAIQKLLDLGLTEYEIFALFRRVV